MAVPICLIVDVMDEASSIVYVTMCCVFPCQLDSPPESARAPGLPNIKEDPASQLATPVSNKLIDMNQLNLTEDEERGLQEALNASLDTPAPPRIDISRASSSSQHEDSITSSPDGETGHNLGYKEDGELTRLTRKGVEECWMNK